MDPKITLTPKAVEKIKEQLTKRNTPDAAIRLGLKSGGCSGYQQIIEFDDSLPREGDHIFEFDGVKVFIDKKSVIYLNGTTLDWEQSLAWQGFKFVSDRVDKTCGCGISVSYKDE